MSPCEPVEGLPLRATIEVGHYDSRDRSHDISVSSETFNADLVDHRHS